MCKVDKIYLGIFSERVFLIFIIHLGITYISINSFREKKVCVELSCRIWKITSRCDNSLQRAPGQLAKNFQHQLSPSGELVPPVRNGVELLRVGQQHLLGSVPQLLRVERVAQNKSTGKEVQSNDIA